MRHFAAVRVRQKTTAPVIGTERFAVTSRPHFHSAIADHRQLNTLATYVTQCIAEIVCRTAGPIKKNVNADEFFLRRLACARRTRQRLFTFAVLPRLQNLRSLTKTLDHSLSKLLRADLLFTHLFVVDVVGVNA